MLRTTRDIVIPAGTELLEPPTMSTRWGKDYEAVIGIDKDHTGWFTIDLDEAITSGLIDTTD